MQGFSYAAALRQHYESYYGLSGRPCSWQKGPREKLHPDFFILEIPPNDKHPFWAYCTVGMSLDQSAESRLELVLYSPYQDDSQVELLTACASYHRNILPLDLHHTVNFGRPWLAASILDHGFISLPYLDGEALEIYDWENRELHCYWLIPITEQERDFKISHGCEALEQLFEDRSLDYLNPHRSSLAAS